MKQLSQEEILRTADLLHNMHLQAESLDDSEVSIHALMEQIDEELKSRNATALLYNRSCVEWEAHLDKLSQSVPSETWKDAIRDLAVPTVDSEWKLATQGPWAFSEVIDVEQVTLQVTEPAA
ncbi:hypothetical protein CMI47_17880 [Candidatus Pacearchaeota archaeon]|nr:hypothetical protein [Candidatus Pacearchaeota archaeon]|tara:strand:- start:10756 stop:11121 length:366 start_codon:yes stop_codon:yes gene_type:complete